MNTPLRIGFALTGSFCTFSKVMPVLETLAAHGCEVTPILSFQAASLDTRFGDASMWRDKITALTGREPETRLPNWRTASLTPRSLWQSKAICAATDQSFWQSRPMTACPEVQPTSVPC